MKEYPANWSITKLREVIASCQNGIWGDEPMPNEKSYPIIRSTEITHDGKIDLSTVSYRKVPNDKIEKYRLEDGDILIVGSSGSPHLIGRAALFEQPNNDQIYLFSNFMIRIRPKNVYPRYLYYFLNSHKYYDFLKGLQQTSTGLRNLPKREFLQLLIPLPPLPEQKAIAKVLSTVDEAIQKVDEAIAKTERLKKGLMQKLLTKGIGHKEFKYSKELGCEIPKEWKVVRIKEITKEFVSGGTPSTKEPKYWNGEIPWIRSVHITKHYIDETSIEQYITREGLKNSAAKIVPKGNLIVATRVGIGKSAINLIDVAINQDLTGVILDKSKINPLFITWYFNSPKVNRLFESFSRGTTIKGIPQNYIRNLLIPLPPLPEQQKIAEILSTVDKKLELERRRKEKLERIKRGLMNDLLTGRKRVNVEKVLGEL